MEYRNNLRERSLDVAESRGIFAQPLENEEAMLARIEDAVNNKLLNKGQASGGQKGLTSELRTAAWACSESRKPTCDPNNPFRCFISCA